MNRLLEANQGVRERRDQLCHPSYAKPELLATVPNQVWSCKPDASERGPCPLAIKDQLRHTKIKITVDFYIGADLAFQREQLEKLRLNSRKIVGNDEFPETRPIATA
jgi:hypothetical protein